MLNFIDFDAFQNVEMRVGEITRAEPYPEARKPAIKLWINFGPIIGEKKSSAQITDHYKPQTLIGKKVLAVINLKPRQIGNFISEVLVLGVPDIKDKGVVLVVPDQDTKIGSRSVSYTHLTLPTNREV